MRQTTKRLLVGAAALVLALGAACTAYAASEKRKIGKIELTFDSDLGIGVDGRSVSVTAEGGNTDRYYVSDTDIINEDSDDFGDSNPPEIEVTLVSADEDQWYFASSSSDAFRLNLAAASKNRYDKVQFVSAKRSEKNTMLTLRVKLIYDKKRKTGSSVSGSAAQRAAEISTVQSAAETSTAQNAAGISAAQSAAETSTAQSTAGTSTAQSAAETSAAQSTAGTSAAQGTAGISSAPGWSSAHPGTASWNGEEGARYYQVQLLRNGEEADIVRSVYKTSYDYSSQMTEPGAYSFRVRTVRQGTHEKSEWVMSGQLVQG